MSLSIDEKVKPFTKVVHPCTVPDAVKVFCSIKWDGTKLSITGVEGPRANGDAWGSCGQISEPGERTPATGWDESMISLFWKGWKRWHLNDMRAGCEHQRAEKWDNSRLSEPCPECGYKYGTAWLTEEVPVDVLQFFSALPESSIIPAWV